MNIAASRAHVVQSSPTAPWCRGQVVKCSLSAGFMFHKFCGGQNMKIAGTMSGSMFRETRNTSAQVSSESVQ